MYYPGDVVTAFYAWENDDGSMDWKPRPVVIVEALPNRDYFIVKITTKKGRGKVRKVLAGTPEFKAMRLTDNSEVCFDETLTLNKRDIIKLIGNCPFIEEILAHHYL